MNENELFEAGCFLPAWAEDTKTEELPVLSAYKNQGKDLETLMGELEQIKESIQEIQARQWNLAKLIDFHRHNLVKE